MAGIGLYGVFYSKCVKSGGVVTGYDGSVKMMGKAIAAGLNPPPPRIIPCMPTTASVRTIIPPAAAAH